MSQEYASGFFGRGYVSGSLGVLAGHGSVWDMSKELQKAKDLGKKLVSDIQSKKKYPLQLAGKRLLTRFVITPIIKKNILEHKDHKMKAVHSNLTERGYL